MNNIALIRQKLRITQEVLASELGWGQSRIGNYESGLRKPDLETSRKIVNALNKLGMECSLNDVFPPASSN